MALCTQNTHWVAYCWYVNLAHVYRYPGQRYRPEQHHVSQPQIYIGKTWRIAVAVSLFQDYLV